MSYTLVSPKAGESSASIAPARRPEALSGLTVGILINGKEYSDIVMERIARGLQADGQIGEVRFWNKGFAARPAPFIEDIARTCSVVVNGVGH